eukprot:6183397-Pleurochrysis_carterae.AAC.2
MYGRTIAEKKRTWLSFAALGIPVVPEVKMCSRGSLLLHVARTDGLTASARGGSFRLVAKGGVRCASMHTKGSRCVPSAGGRRCCFSIRGARVDTASPSKSTSRTGHCPSACSREAPRNAFDTNEQETPILARPSQQNKCSGRFSQSNAAVSPATSPCANAHFATRLDSWSTLAYV